MASAGFDQASKVRAGLYKYRNVLTPFVDFDFVDPGPGCRRGGKHRQYVQLLDLVAAALGLMFPGHAGGRFYCRHDDAQDIDLASQIPSVARQPGLLQTAKCDSRGCIAGQNHKVAARREQTLAPGPGQVDNGLAVLAAVGRVGLVSEIDEIGLRKPVHKLSMDGQAANSGIKNAYRHGSELPDLRPQDQCSAGLATARG